MILSLSFQYNINYFLLMLLINITLIFESNINIIFYLFNKINFIKLLFSLIYLLILSI